jgi:hypothetical protein
MNLSLYNKYVILEGFFRFFQKHFAGHTWRGRPRSGFGKAGKRLEKRMFIILG